MLALHDLRLAFLPWWHRWFRYPSPSQSTVCVHCATGPLAPLSWKKMMHDKGAVVYRTTLVRLLAGEKANCQLCRFLVDLAGDTGRPKDEVQVDFQLDQDPDNPVDQPADTQYLLVHARVGELADRYMTYCMYTPADDPAADEIVCKAPILQVDSPRARELALKLINDCIANHASCLKPKKTPLPTRVIDCQVPTKPRLIITENLEDAFVPYVALSYVWGSNASHITRLANYERYQAGIDYNIVPQTIRDAITVTHGLRMRYIWVDAFCIIQDSDEDRVRELVKMGDIYLNAYFTIIASSSPDGGAGFLQDRVLPSRATLPFYCRNGRLGSVCIGKRGETVPSSIPGREPVDRRAWCFQEWLLSPRKVLYTTDTLRYHCQTDARPVENSLRAIRTVQSSTLDHAFLPLPLAVLANPDLAELSQEEHIARQCMLWSLAVSNYTQRLLTRKTDKLLAFAAVAEQFDHTWLPECRPERYVAGLWEGFLPRDLLWHREFFTHQWLDDALRPRPAEYLAPSWAWPSVDGHVRVRAGAAYNPNEGIVDVCDVLECAVTLRDERLPYGQVTAGHLKLGAVVAPAWIVFEPPDKPSGGYGDTFYYRLFAPSRELRSQMAGSDASEAANDPVLVHGPMMARDPGRLLAVGRGTFSADDSLLMRVGQCDLYFDSDERAAADESWLVLINRGERTGWGGDLITGEGLLVTRADLEGDRFRRLGYWSLTLKLSADAVGLDEIAPWMRMDAERRVVELI